MRKLVTFTYTSDGQHGAAIEQQVTDFLKNNPHITVLAANGSFVHDTYNGGMIDLKWERYYLIYQENK